MPELENRVTELIAKVMEAHTPSSVFIYGSRGRGDHRTNSDYEIGVLYKDGQKIKREALAQMNDQSDVNLFTFSHESLLAGSIDTPFPQSLFLYELASGGAATIAGESVVESLPKPEVTGQDIIARIHFDIAIALSAMLSERAGDQATAEELFSKSCLFGARSLSIVSDQAFPLTYNDIVDSLSNQGIGEFSEVVRKALLVRLGSAQLETNDYYKNIEFLASVVRDRVYQLEDLDQVLLS